MAVRFDAAGDRASYSGANPPAPGSGLTVTAWAYISVDQNDEQTWVRIWASPNTTVGTFATDSDGTGGPAYFTGGGSMSSPTNFVVGEWRKVAVTCSGTTGHVYAALPAGATSHVSGTVSVGTPTGITLGGRGPSDAAEWFNGRLAHVRVWSAQLTQTEIEAEWASSTPVRTSNIWANWPLATATDLTDTTNSRTLTVLTGPLTTEAGPPLPVTGSLAATVLAAVSSVAGTARAAGPVAGSARALTGNVVGAATATGGITGTSPAVTGVLPGVAAASGIVAGQLPPPTASLAATAAASGTVQGTTPAAAGEAAADASAAGVLAWSLSPLSGDVAGQAAQDGTLTAILSPATGVFTCEASTGGAVAATLPVLTGSVSVFVDTGAGALSGVLPGAAADLPGGAVTAGLTAGVLSAPSVTVTGSATSVADLVVVIPLPAAALAGTGSSAGALAAAAPVPAVAWVGAVGAAVVPGAATLFQRPVPSTGQRDLPTPTSQVTEPGVPTITGGA